jgi:hypothetical protein
MGQPVTKPRNSRSTAQHSLQSSSWKHRKRFPSQACPAKMVYEAKFEFIFGGRDFRGTNSHLYIKTVGPKNLGKTPKIFTFIYIYINIYIYIS